MYIYDEMFFFFCACIYVLILIRLRGDFFYIAEVVTVLNYIWLLRYTHMRFGWQGYGVPPVTRLH